LGSLHKHFKELQCKYTYNISVSNKKHQKSLIYFLWGINHQLTDVNFFFKKLTNIFFHYFQSSTFRKKEEINEMYIRSKYSDKLKEFSLKMENKRSKNCFLMINLMNDMLYIAKSKKEIFEKLQSQEILVDMYSNKQLDFTKKNVFDKYNSSCVNYHLAKIALTNK
jgi:hypothetical protein